VGIGVGAGSAKWCAPCGNPIWEDDRPG